MGEQGGLSASDVLALTNRDNGGMFGGDLGGIIGLLIVAGLLNGGLGGFGGNGGGNRGGSGVADNYILATDFATIERKLDSVNSGICDATFALNNTIVNGFNGVQNTLCQGFNGLNIAYLQTSNQLGREFADCCCKTQRAIDGINYNMAMNTSAIQQTLCGNTRDIIENQNANYRALHEELIANKLEMKNERIAELQAQVNKLQLRESQANQNAYLLNELKPCPSAAYIVPNPNCCYNYQVTGVGYGNNGCGCGY